jgi:serine O-acetyltransferase
MWQRLKEEINVVFERDPAARSVFEVITTYPGLHALYIYRLSHKMWQMGLFWPARFLSFVGRWLTGIEIHPGATIGKRVFIDHGMGVVIGETAEVGDDCTLYHGVTLGGTSWKKGKRHPTLHNNVVVGAGAKILGPIQVGAGAKIGSNAVVVRDVPEGATVIGVPGRILVKDGETGFVPYGVRDQADPMAQTINALMEHIDHLENKINELVEERAKSKSRPRKKEPSV